MPIMDRALNVEVNRGLCELFENAFAHADSASGCIAIGQLYPNKQEVQICVCDAGIGIPERVRLAGYRFPRQSEAIAWSLENGTTTRAHDGPPGGLGLFLLRNFVRVNGGTVRIIANRGYYSCSSGSPILTTLPCALPGTLLQFKFRLLRNVVYQLGD